MPIQNITELELDELKSTISNLDSMPFHAEQIFRWIYQRGVTDFSQMTDLSTALRSQLSDSFVIPTPSVVHRQESTDGTIKFLIRLSDGFTVEGVFIPDTPAMTFCISTQVGCAMQCRFCLTGKMGLSRNLTAGEIADQVRVMAKDVGLLDQTFNVVFMGMGEPLHNFNATMKSLRILTTSSGFAVPQRRITLSTVGVLPALTKLANESVMPNLAVSLHATTEELRDKLVPINKKYGLNDLVQACRRFPVKRRERITFEYVLLADVNDSSSDVERLAILLKGIRAKVNVIPLNEAPGIPFRRPSDARINSFGRALSARGVRVFIRKSRGRDIRAACGQLFVESTQLSSE